jgi:hypothetical protein
VFKADKFYLLGHAHGLVPTDNFEFPADYYPGEGLHFLTELEGPNAYKLPAGSKKKICTRICRSGGSKWRN